MSKAVEFKDVSIAFGGDVAAALKLADEGRTRDEISHSTGSLLGVANASLSVDEGEILVLMGLSGSGKSTLLRAVNGLAPVIRGEIEVSTSAGRINPYGCTARHLREFRMRSVSMVFQQFALLPWRTVSENVGFGLELAKFGEKELKARVEQQLELVNLTKWAGRKVSELSGGMQQRVGLARAFATGAPILLMDEPFSALDPLIRTRLQDELLELQRSLRKTIIFVSHDLDEAFRIGNRIAIMEGGRIVQCGTPQEILKRPADRYVADFVANMNPINVLKAGDVMRPCSATASDSSTWSQSVETRTPIVEVMSRLASGCGPLAVHDGQGMIGMIAESDVIMGLARHRMN